MNKKEYDLLIVGAGIYGATAAYKAKQEGKRCLVIDVRPHLGGNIYCESIEGINVHKYGAHIFHTNNKKVWEFVNSIVEFNRYTNSPIANYKGRQYNLPFNMNTFYQMWGVTTPEEARKKIEEQRREQGLTCEPQNLEEQAISLVGRDIYEILIKGYTEKQWGRRCCDLPSFIIRRLPVRYTFDNNYFNDRYQGIPEGGYNRLIEGLLKGMECRTGCDYLSDREHWNAQAGTVVYTGAIDEYFDYRLGRLEYRSLRFEHEVIPIQNYQGNAIINYTSSEVPFTRIVEHKHFDINNQQVQQLPVTVITREYPMTGAGLEPYYPVNDERNNRLYEQYRELAEQEPHVIFGGRLATYRYMDMDEVMESAMMISRR